MRKHGVFCHTYNVHHAIYATSETTELRYSETCQVSVVVALPVTRYFAITLKVCSINSHRQNVNNYGLTCPVSFPYSEKNDCRSTIFIAFFLQVYRKQCIFAIKSDEKTKCL